jgi:hypothetical protein
MEAEAKKDEEGHAWHRADGQRAKANASGAPYNPVNHHMQESERGHFMIEKERATRERATRRAENLRQKGNSAQHPFIH